MHSSFWDLSLEIHGCQWTSECKGKSMSWPSYNGRYTILIMLSKTQSKCVKIVHHVEHMPLPPTTWHPNLANHRCKPKPRRARFTYQNRHCRHAARAQVTLPQRRLAADNVLCIETPVSGPLQLLSLGGTAARIIKQFARKSGDLAWIMKWCWNGGCSIDGLVGESAPDWCLFNVCPSCTGVLRLAFNPRSLGSESRIKSITRIKSSNAIYGISCPNIRFEEPSAWCKNYYPCKQILELGSPK